MTRGFALRLLFTLALSLTGCAHSRFDPPSEFARLDEKQTIYQQRATSAHGVVIAVREVQVAEGASLAFWSDAITQRLSGSQGYALLAERDVRAKSGEAGKLLAFGRDQNGHTFDYWVALFSKGKRLVLMEMGGRRDRFDQSKAQVERALASVELH